MGYSTSLKTGTIKPGGKLSVKGVIFRNFWQLSCLNQLLWVAFNEPLWAVSEQHVQRDGVNRSKSMKHPCPGWVTFLSVLLTPSSLGKSSGLRDSKWDVGVLARDVGRRHSLYALCLDCSTLSLEPVGGRLTAPVLLEA